MATLLEYTRSTNQMEYSASRRVVGDMGDQLVHARGRLS